MALQFLHNNYFRTCRQVVLLADFVSVNDYFAVTATREPNFVSQIKAGAVKLRSDARTAFLSHVEKNNGSGCWNWHGSASVYLGNNHSIPAPVLAFVIFRGAIDGNGSVCQVCRNNACVNPEHLRVRQHSTFGVQTGRPRIGVARLNVTIDGVVQEELARCEQEQGAHRNDVARQVLCEWALAQRANRLSGSLHQT
jgi:hypothetical protein